MHGEMETVRIIDERTVEVDLPSKLGYERIAMACAASFARMLGMGPARIEDLKTAVSEACLNAIEHGNQGRPQARVVVTMNHKDDTFAVSVMDEGGGMPSLPPEPSIEAMMDSPALAKGMGIFLMQQLVDNVRFNQMTRNRHAVTMEIRLTQPGS